MWLDPFCRNLELANQADHEDDLPENLSEITDLWNSPARTHVCLSEQESQLVPNGLSVSSCISITVFTNSKKHLKSQLNYNCNMQLSPVNGVKLTSYNSHKIMFH